MSTSSFESGANVPSAFSVSTPSTPFEVRTASVLMRFTARCSSTRTVASPLNGVAMNRAPPAGTGGVALPLAAACDAVADAGWPATPAPAPPPQAASRTITSAKERRRTSDRPSDRVEGSPTLSIDGEGWLGDDRDRRDDRRPRRVKPARDRQADQPPGDRDAERRRDPRRDGESAAHGD